MLRYMADKSGVEIDVFMFVETATPTPFRYLSLSPAELGGTTSGDVGIPSALELEAGEIGVVGSEEVGDEGMHPPCPLVLELV